MQGKALTTYYFLSTVVLAAGFFVIQPTQIPEMKSFQGEIKNQISVAWQQTLGDGPWFEDLQFVFDTVENFYQQAADSTIAMIQSPESDGDISYVFGTLYQELANTFHQKALPKVAGAATHVQQVEISSTIDQKVSPVNTPDMPWVTLRDNYTGQLYCVAMYNGTVNQYLGPCQSGYQ